jgi:ribosome-interacting GTPase 1
MPANLTPQYLAAEQRFKEAASAQEKLEALDEMMAVIPKHKGTEKIRADLRRRAAKLRKETRKKHGISKASLMYSVPREGAGQVVLAGGANSGKSSLLARLTNASPEIGNYPFTTRLPQSGMMPYENIQIQLVDMPPIDPHYYEPWMGGIIRQADFVLLVGDLSTDQLLDDIQNVFGILQNSKIHLSGKPADSSIPPPGECLRSLLIANKCDAPRARENLSILLEFFGAQFDIIAASTMTGEGLDTVPKILFDRLNIIRIYTKSPGKKVDLNSPPFVLKKGSTVIDAARAVHRGFVQSMKYAKVWSSEKSTRPAKYSGRLVERTHPLEDGDILELHV